MAMVTSQFGEGFTHFLQVHREIIYEDDRIIRIYLRRIVNLFFYIINYLIHNLISF